NTWSDGSEYVKRTTAGCAGRGRISHHATLLTAIAASATTAKGAARAHSGRRATRGTGTSLATDAIVVSLRRTRIVDASAMRRRRSFSRHCWSVVRTTAGTSAGNAFQ